MLGINTILQYSYLEITAHDFQQNFKLLYIIIIIIIITYHIIIAYTLLQLIYHNIKIKYVYEFQLNYKI